MLEHKITFAKCIKEDIESNEFVLRAEVKLPNDKILLKIVNKFIKSYPKTVKYYIKDTVECYVNNNVLYINIKTLAKCSQYDVPDKIKGKRIAESKAKSKLYKTLNYVSGIIYKYYCGVSELYKTSRDRYLNLKERELEHIEELSNML